MYTNTDKKERKKGKYTIVNRSDRLCRFLDTSGDGSARTGTISFPKLDFGDSSGAEVCASAMLHRTGLSSFAEKRKVRVKSLEGKQGKDLGWSPLVVTPKAIRVKE
jgi:hypothetical protein